MKITIITTLITAIFYTINIYGETKYYDASQFSIIGKPVYNNSIQYGRLPDSLENKIRQPLWDLGRNSAGIAIRFSSNTTSISAKWDVWLIRNMNHMTPTGIRGLDLYCLQDNGTWAFVNCARPGNEKSNIAKIVTDMEPRDREYMLYLPLYDQCTALEIGIDSAAVINKPKIASPSTIKPIVWYGSSILQGGCASRPGMAVTNIISRNLNHEVINLGFSGNGQLDYEIAEVMAAVDAGMYILDFVPNATEAQMDERIETFYRIIRDKHPKTPILFVEDPQFPPMRFEKKTYTSVLAKNKTLKKNFDDLKNKGEKNIYYIASKGMLDKENEGTVDGYHMTDLGFTHFANFMLPYIKKHLK